MPTVLCWVGILHVVSTGPFPSAAMSAGELCCVVVDELHMVSDTDRGIGLEMSLRSAGRLAPLALNGHKQAAGLCCMLAGRNWQVNGPEACVEPNAHAWMNGLMRPSAHLMPQLMGPTLLQQAHVLAGGAAHPDHRHERHK